MQHSTRCPYYALWRAERLSSLDRHIVYDDAIVASNSSNMAHLCLVYMCRRHLGRSSSHRRYGVDATLDEMSWWCAMAGLEVNSRWTYRVWMAPILQIWCSCVWYICEDDIWGALQAIVVMGEIQHSTRCPVDDCGGPNRQLSMNIPCMMPP